MKIGILTSTRADFGIYRPLLVELKSDSFFELELIVFGSHLSKMHGETISEIKNNGFVAKHILQTIPDGDRTIDISKSIGKTIIKFSEFWNNNKFDLVFALGDRYEMFAAVSAASPFNVKIAHIHAGETTLGAIDNAYRHSISLMSEYLFVSTDKYMQRGIEIHQKPENIFNVGALSIDNLKNTELYSLQEFEKQFNINLDKPTILSTFHPETVSFEKNTLFIDNLLQSLDVLRKDYQIVITMPNADTMGMTIRTEIEKFAKNKGNIILVESFGMKGYLSCMKFCEFLLGNTSSGFVEASYFPKWVINIGERQKGRIVTDNIISVPIEKQNILDAVDRINSNQLPQNCNVYGGGETAKKMKIILHQLVV